MSSGDAQTFPDVVPLPQARESEALAATEWTGGVSQNSNAGALSGAQPAVQDVTASLFPPAPAGSHVPAGIMSYVQHPGVVRSPRSHPVAPPMDTRRFARRDASRSTARSRSRGTAGGARRAGSRLSVEPGPWGPYDSPAHGLGPEVADTPTGSARPTSSLTQQRRRQDDHIRLEKLLQLNAPATGLPQARTRPSKPAHAPNGGRHGGRAARVVSRSTRRDAELARTPSMAAVLAALAAETGWQVEPDDGRRNMAHRGTWCGGGVRVIIGWCLLTCVFVCAPCVHGFNVGRSICVADHSVRG